LDRQLFNRRNYAGSQPAQHPPRRRESALPESLRTRQYGLITEPTQRYSRESGRLHRELPRLVAGEPTVRC